jgi:hypothetical protein
MVHIPFSGTIKKWCTQRKILSELKETNWRFSEKRLDLLLAEDWARYYLPIDVTGLTILDVGAGEGETAKFFLDHGATKIICIEPEPIAAKTLNANALNHPGKIEVYPRFFELSDLSLKHDFMKMDIEGYEESLLSGIQLSAPAVIEVHGLQLRDKFRKQNYRIDDEPNRNGIGCISFAYWKC